MRAILRAANELLFHAVGEQVAQSTLLGTAIFGDTDAPETSLPTGAGALVEVIEFAGDIAVDEADELAHVIGRGDGGEHMIVG